MTDSRKIKIKHEAKRILTDWILSCTRGGKVSRNTIAVGIVVIDHLRKQCPVMRRNVISRGGEVKGARSGLKSILESYGIPRRYLKEVTTRQGHQDGQRLFEAFDWGEKLQQLPAREREQLLLELITDLSLQIKIR